MSGVKGCVWGGNEDLWNTGMNQTQPRHAYVSIVIIERDDFNKGNAPLP
jgi:hypothetical protein